MKNPKGEVKMSEVLEAFVEPYVGFAENQNERETLLTIAVVAWNLSLIPEKERPSMMDKLIKAALKENHTLDQQEARAIINELMARKQKFFAKNKRFIVDFQLEDIGKHYHLSVASTLTNSIVPDSDD
ncbi:hypothetical protein [Oscillatoria acuminata]|nr:hypothetical protein [Oscillatoria acuminata]